MMFRQGDVLLVEVEAIPEGAQGVKRDEAGRIVLALGEATGHAHAIASPGARLYAMGENRYLRVPKGGATLLHEEHAVIPLPPGGYRVVIQREYSPEAVRRVQD